MNAGGKEGNGVQGYVKALEEREKAKSDNDALFREEEPLESTMDSQAETERIGRMGLLVRWLSMVHFEAKHHDSFFSFRFFFRNLLPVVDRTADTLHWLQEVAFEPYAAANTSKDLSEKIKRFTNVVS